MKCLSASKSTKYTIAGVATVQEEIGSRGAVIAGYKIDPDIAITVDLDFATDVPDCNPNRYGKVMLGNGVVISRNADNDWNLSRQIEAIAKGNNIPFQISARPHATGALILHGSNSPAMEYVLYR